jgi:hypothetical protein
MKAKIIAALPNPPKCTISVGGKAMKRGALKTEAMAVPHDRVGNSSGSHTGIHEYCSGEQRQIRVLRPQEQNRGREKRHDELQHGGWPASYLVGEEAKADIAEETAEIVSHPGIRGPLLRRQVGR